MKKAPTIRELDRRKLEQKEPAGLDAADALMGVFGFYRRPRGENEPDDVNAEAFGDWT